MKKLMILTSLSAFLMIFVFSAYVFSKDFSESQQEIIAENLTAGLKSENPGVRIACAQRIFELIDREGFNEENFSSSIIPLMKMVREDNSELEKISAALSLYKLEDARGMFLLKRLAEFDNNKKVGSVEKNLYNTYIKNY